jgi:hypothetical protein
MALWELITMSYDKIIGFNLPKLRSISNFAQLTATIQDLLKGTSINLVHGKNKFLRKFI